ncbi:hypothetical protein QR680_011990 [Steinernema hermaphroditum]|uniref:Uncharacterized protein n=1 Tax=Steinernema hermaphroditum TaxID=289476 RepID=A0AA39I0G3_9BILA|nr:hypothetical protein QR680_011990 [Steinernema hermaphroditum]
MMFSSGNHQLTAYVFIILLLSPTTEGRSTASGAHHHRRNLSQSANVSFSDAELLNSQHRLAGLVLTTFSQRETARRRSPQEVTAKFRHKRLDPLSIGSVALIPMLVEGLTALGTLIGTFLGGLVLGFALDEGDVADLTRKMEGLLAGTEVKPTAKTILDLCSGNELSCLKAIIPAMREKQKGRMAIGAAVDAAEAALSSE